jgi:hypothetical protein
MKLKPFIHPPEMASRSWTLSTNCFILRQCIVMQDQ